MGARVWAAMAVASVSTQPAWSNGGAVLRGEAPLQTWPAPAFVGPAAPAARAERVLPRKKAAIVRNDDDNDGFRRRPSSPMMEFYPVEGSSFHLVGGARFDLLARAVRTPAKFTDLIYAPRGLFNRGGRRSLRRITPSAGMGYGVALGSNFTFNLEGGARIEPDRPQRREFGRFLRRGSRGGLGGFRNASGRSRSDGGMNPVMQLSLGYKF